jgi:hypothetical protein
MQCHNCRSQQPEGVTFCQNCGAPIAPQSPSSVAPTVAASQPPYGSPSPDANYHPSSVAPTVAASQPPYGNANPYTNYNQSPPPASGQPYDAAHNPYASASYNPYAQPQQGNVPPYAPPPNSVPGYTPPPQSNAAAYGAGTFAGSTPAKPKRKGGLIAGIIIAVLVIIIAVILAMPKSSPTTTTTTTTATAPSNTPTDSTASSIVTNIQMASAVDTDSLQPTTLATSFKKNTNFYATFQFDFSSTDVSQQKPGYVEARYYVQNRRILTSEPLKVDDNIAPNGRGYGYFTAVYYQATTAGSVELYWCRQSNCSDAKLAGTTTFTIY